MIARRGKKRFVVASALVLFATGTLATGTLAAQGAPVQDAPVQEAPVADGKTTFDVVCAACHSIEPPHKLAPPMLHIAGYYRRAFATEAEFVEAIVQWVTSPAKERSKLPAHAVERFGLMAAFPLPEPQLRAVGHYVWSLSTPPDSAAQAPAHTHNP